MPHNNEEVVQKVKARLQEEGREARNLIAYYSVPVDEDSNPSRNTHQYEPISNNAPRRNAKTSKRPRSSSAGRDPQASMRARHWGFLFRNLQQAVDEIYQTCEHDESIIECKEAMLMLRRYTSDFEKLIEWLKLKWEYENTLPPQRPTSLSWEIRTSSPGKAFQTEKKNNFRRALNFDKLDSTKSSKLSQRIQEESSVIDLLKDTKCLPPKQLITPPKLIEGNDESRIDISNKIEPKTPTKNFLAKISENHIGSNVTPEHNIPSQTNHLCLNSDNVILNEVTNHKDIDIKINDQKSNSNELNQDKSDENNSTKLTDCNSKDSLIKDDETKTIHNSESQSCRNIRPSGKTTTNKNTVSIKKKSREANRSKDLSFNNNKSSLTSSKRVLRSKNTDLKEYKSDGSTENIPGKLKKSLKEKNKPTSKENKNLSENDKLNLVNSTLSSNLNNMAPLITDLPKSAESTCDKKSTKEDKMSNSKPKNEKEKIEKIEEPKLKKDKQNETKSKIDKIPDPKSDDKISDAKSKSEDKNYDPHTKNENKTDNNNLKKDGKEDLQPIKYDNIGVVKLKMDDKNESSKHKKSIETQDTKSKIDKPDDTKPTKNDRTDESVKPKKDKSEDNKPKQDDKLEDKTTLLNQTKYSNTKHGPTVNMNKASQVRQAFNQNRTPQKQNRHSFEKQYVARSLDKNHPKQSSSFYKQKRSIHDFGNSPPSTRRFKDASNKPAAPRRSHTTLGIEGNKISGMHSSNKSLSNVSTSSAPSPVGISWADKVRGCVSLSQQTSPSQLSLQEDEDGWEVVRRGRRSHGGSTASLNSHSSTNSTRNSYKHKLGFSSAKAKNRFNIPTAATSLPSLNIDKKVNSQSQVNDKNMPCEKTTKENMLKNVHQLKRTKSMSVNSHERTSRRSCKKQRSLSFSKENKNDLFENEDTKCSEKECSSVKSDYTNVDKTESEEKNLHNDNLPKDDDMSKGTEILFDNKLDSNACNSPEKIVNQNDSLPTPASMIVEKEARSYDSDSGMDEEEMRFNAAALESAVLEEHRLKKQMEETEKTEIEIEDEACHDGNFDASDKKHKYQYDHLLSTLSWAEQMETLDSLEELRHPGRVLHIHEKLSSPSRKLPLKEKLRRHQVKLAKAQELRDKLMMAKTEKLKDLSKRIEEVAAEKDKLLGEKRRLFQRKMERAEEKRRQHLQEIVNKAHDEEKKAKEIAFINGLEAQNKLHDIMQQHQVHESRLADMAEERCRKQEEKAAKEAAAQERRKALEAERKARMEELCEKRRQKCERIDRQQAERREEMLEQAREKARDHKERLSAIHMAQQAKETELVKRIQQKQEDSARRHEENMELIRQKALESSILSYSKGCDDAPKLIRYETKKLCTLCNCLIASEVYLLSHLRSRKHQEALQELHKCDISTEETATYNLKHIINAPANVDDPEVTRDKERQKSLKKRCKKLRSRMSSRGKDYANNFKIDMPKDTPNKGRINKSLQQICKLVTSQGTGPWSTSDTSLLDKYLLELQRIFDKKHQSDQTAFLAFDGFSKLQMVMQVILAATEDQPSVISSRSLGYAGKVLLNACQNNIDVCLYLVNSNLVGTLVDYLVKRLEELTSTTNSNNLTTLISDCVSVSIFEVCAEVLRVLINSDISKNEKDNSIWLRLQDLVSYCVSVGIADKVSWYLSRVQGPVDHDQGIVDFILSSMSLISALAQTIAAKPGSDDPTQLIGTFQVTDGCGVVSLLYGLLLHEGGRSSQESPPQLSETTTAITDAATSFLKSLASLNLSTFQNILGSEGISLEFRHISSYLLWYSSHWTCTDILHNIIILVGYFTISNKENQMVIQSGEMPSVLQQLINLPWPYFSEPKLSDILFPTLLACCLNNPDNIHILKQDMSFQILEDYIKSETCNEDPLIKLIHRAHIQG